MGRGITDRFLVEWRNGSRYRLRADWGNTRAGSTPVSTTRMRQERPVVGGVFGGCRSLSSGFKGLLDALLGRLGIALYGVVVEYGAWKRYSHASVG